jgi:hypothetical protein
MHSVPRMSSLLLVWSLAAVACDETEPDPSTVYNPTTGMDSSLPPPVTGGQDSGTSMIPVPPSPAQSDATTPVANDGGMGPIPPIVMQDAGSAADAGTATDSGAADTGTSATPDAATSTSNFPPVAIDKLGSAGGFMAVTKTGVGPSGGYNVYHPQELGRNGVKHPVLTWGNGAATFPELYPLLPHLATHGFVVIAAQTSFVDGATLKAGLDWMLAQNNASGEFQGKLDPTKTAAFGYSLGSLATFEIGTDPRLTTTVHISGGLMGSDRSQATAIKVPSAYFCDKDETGVNCDGDFNAQHTYPRFYGRVPGAVHVDYVFNDDFINRMNAAVTGWVRWQMMGDTTSAGMFVGANCTLCRDSYWEVQKKNMD